MLKGLVFLLRFYIFWLIFFFLDRLIFLLYFPQKLKGTSFSEFVKTFLNGIRLDMSMAGYVSALPLLVFIACWVAKVKISEKIPRIYTRTIIILFSFITIVNFNIYREWGTKINFRALDFAINAPNEALASSSSSPILSSFLIFFVLLGCSFLIERRLIRYKILPIITVNIWSKIALSFILIFLTFTAIRGGWQLSPINESMSYFSEKPFLNHAADNTEWTLIHDVIDNKYGNKNPYRYYDIKEANKIVDSLFVPSTIQPPQILTTKRPNVVIVILESYAADLVESLGGEKGIDPNLEKLIDEGLFFSNIYAAGDRTDKGLIAILSGFPSQAIRSILKINNKHEKLSSLAQDFRKLNYNTSFYYGGESEFFNLKSYILSHSYQKLIDKHDFKAKDMNSKWGAYDDVVFEKQLADLKTENEPFFSTLLTLTNHEPFELPVKARFPGETEGDKFRSTAYYTDSCIAAYLNEAKKESWYKNTLFVFVADHGHRLPKNEYENYNPRRFKIPLLFYGEVLKKEFRGKDISKLGNQTDLAATLLSQLNINPQQYKWSKDLLNPETSEFAFFNWDNGFGFAVPQQTLSFDNVSKNVIFKKNEVPDSTNSEITRYGKAFMQTVFDEYMKY